MKQHSTPVIIRGEKAISLEKVPLESTSYSEDWIQNLCFNNPNLLPISELEPVFDGLIPICRELATKAGYVDLIYINEDGFITIGECKLWRNPEAHRKVVGQILDYAKELAKWDYSKFESECLKARKQDEKSLLEIFQKRYFDIEEAYFIDNVQKHLKKGQFLLLIIGDGIRENMEAMIKYIHRNENLHFTLGLIELLIFKNPEEDEFIISPRILAKTKEILIHRVSDQLIKEDSQPDQMKEKSQTISEQVFFERLEKNIGTERTFELKQLFTTLSSQLDIEPSLGRGKNGAINLKSSNGYNFMAIFEHGGIGFHGNGRWSNNKEFLFKYMNKIADVVNGRVDEIGLIGFGFSIRKMNGKKINIVDILKIKDKWITIINETLSEAYKLMEDD